MTSPGRKVRNASRAAWLRLVGLLVLLVVGRAEAYRPFDQTDADVAEFHVMEP